MKSSDVDSLKRRDNEAIGTMVHVFFCSPHSITNHTKVHATGRVTRFEIADRGSKVFRAPTRVTSRSRQPERTSDLA